MNFPIFNKNNKEALKNNINKNYDANKLSNNSLEDLKKETNVNNKIISNTICKDLKNEKNLKFNLESDNINIDIKLNKNNILSNENKIDNKKIITDKNNNDKIFFDNKNIMKIDITKEILNFKDKSFSDIINEYKKSNCKNGILYVDIYKYLLSKEETEINEPKSWPDNINKIKNSKELKSAKNKLKKNVEIL